MSFDDGQILALVESLRKEIKDDRKELRDDINRLYELQSSNMLILNEIKEQALKTNGRVNKLESEAEGCKSKIDKFEKETEVVRFFSKYPALLKLAISLVFIGSAGGVSAVVKALLK